MGLMLKAKKIKKLIKNFNLARISLTPMKTESILKVHIKTKLQSGRKLHNILRINMIWLLPKNTNNLSKFSIMSICLSRLLGKLNILMKSKTEKISRRNSRKEMKNRRKEMRNRRKEMRKSRKEMRKSRKEMRNQTWTNSTTCNRKK
jgi:hypothetical protein